MSTLMELMSRDPNKCTKDDIREIIKAFRERRQQFVLGNLSAGSTKAPTAKFAEIMKSVKSDDLDL
jgi:hypothetical protein